MRRDFQSMESAREAGNPDAGSSSGASARGRYIHKDTKLIVTSQEAQKKSFYGVDFAVLSYGPESMITKMLYKSEDNVPFHSHPNEQIGYVVTGKYRIKLSDYDQEIGPGDSYSIPVNMEHSIEVIEAGEVLDFFTPPRDDYL
jgi:quercetin dioxygenase-like cupin family protein